MTLIVVLFETFYISLCYKPPFLFGLCIYSGKCRKTLHSHIYFTECTRLISVFRFVTASTDVLTNIVPESVGVYHFDTDLNLTYQEVSMSHRNHRASINGNQT